VICWSSGSTPCLPRRRTTRRRCQSPSGKSRQHGSPPICSASSATFVFGCGAGSMTDCRCGSPPRQAPSRLSALKS
jgi:hypothetical protein